MAADDLEAMLLDPNVKDPWARDVATLARRGQGRHPFAMEGGLVTLVEMPHAGPALIVPCELEGESILALVATAVGEVVIDSATRRHLRPTVGAGSHTRKIAAACRRQAAARK